MEKKRLKELQEKNAAKCMEFQKPKVITFYSATCTAPYGTEISGDIDQKLKLN